MFRAWVALSDRTKGLSVEGTAELNSQKGRKKAVLFLSGRSDFVVHTIKDKNMKRFAVTLFMLVMPVLAFAQPDSLWCQTFGGGSWSYGRSAKQTSDGSCIWAENTSSFGARGGKPYEQFFTRLSEFNEEKPKFPPPDERKKIQTERRVLTRYPIISVNSGLLLRFRDYSELNASFRRFEAAYGFQSGEEFSRVPPSWSLSIGIRFFPVRRWSLWWEYGTGGKNGVSLIGLSGLYSVVYTNSVSVSIGVGGVEQRLRAERDYSCAVGHSGGTLERISVDTGSQSGWLFTTVLDLWGQTSGHTTGLFLALKYVAAPVVSELLWFPSTQTGTETEMRASMSGLLLSGGLTFSF